MVHENVSSSILRTSLCITVEVCFPVPKYRKGSRKESIPEAALLLCFMMDQRLTGSQSGLEQKGWQWRPFVRLLSKYSPIRYPFLQFTHTLDQIQAKHRPSQFMCPEDKDSLGVRCLSSEDAVFEEQVGTGSCAQKENQHQDYSQ